MKENYYACGIQINSQKLSKSLDTPQLNAHTSHKHIKHCVSVHHI